MQIHGTHSLFALILIFFGGVLHPGNARLPVARAICSQEEPATEWKRYKVRDEDFSVSLPVTPAMTTMETQINENKYRRERSLGAYANGVVYAIYTFEKKFLSTNDLSRRFVKNEAQSEPVTVSGVSGKAYKYETDEHIEMVQVFATARNLYVFQASGSKLGNPAVGMPRFFSSILFSGAPEGTEALDGPGQQPIVNNETASSKAFSGRQVTLKARVITKPEPRYTEIARQRHITGPVVLRCIFTSSGTITNIIAVESLTDGLTENAIGSARQIRFIPAIKDGKFVSVWMELQYNFNLY